MHAANVGDRWMLRLASDEEIVDTLEAFAREHGIRAAAVASGIGQVVHAVLGFWNGHEYAFREIAGPSELVSLSGSLAESEEGPSAHLHATLGRPDLSTLGGHVRSARVGLLAEILVLPFPGRTFRRPFDPLRGLRLLEVEAARPDGPRDATDP